MVSERHLIFISSLFIGGGRNNKFPEFILDHVTGSMSDYDTFVRFLELRSPLDYSVEGRLLFEPRSKGEQSQVAKGIASLSSSSSPLWVALIVTTLQHFFVL